VEEYLRRVAAYREHVHRLVTGQLSADLAAVTARLAADLAAARTPGMVRAAARRAAAALRGLRPDIARLLAAAVPEGVRVGASGAHVDPSQALADPALRDAIRTAAMLVRRHAARTAASLTALPLATPAQQRAVAARIGSVMATLDAIVDLAVGLAVWHGARQAARTRHVELVWVAKRGCCPRCARLAGTVTVDGEFPGGAVPGRVHQHCRCVGVEEEDGLAARLAGTAAADIAAGHTAASTPQRVAAIRDLLAHRRDLTARTRIAAAVTVHILTRPRTPAGSPTG